MRTRTEIEPSFPQRPRPAGAPNVVVAYAMVLPICLVSRRRDRDASLDRQGPRERVVEAPTWGAGRAQ
ncbi:MAG: hypothetical protein WBB07_02785 [Mycobacterium sp.]